MSAKYKYLSIFPHPPPVPASVKPKAALAGINQQKSPTSTDTYSYPFPICGSRRLPVIYKIKCPCKQGTLNFTGGGSVSPLTSFIYIVMNILKTILYFLIIIICSCGISSKTQKQITRLDVLREANKFADSLQNQQIDTILIFYKGCSGCIEGLSKVAYIFWVEKNQNFVAKASTYHMYKQPIISENVVGFYNMSASYIKRKKH
ncbi:MAG: hypothetical protein ACKVTZ_14690 [Bacteroidia bacterium]